MNPPRAAALAALRARTVARGQVQWDNRTTTYVAVAHPTDTEDARVDAETVALLMTAVWRRYGHAVRPRTAEHALEDAPFPRHP
jgi:hypothetical protein